MCKLRRSIYGLKQSPRQWYLEIDSYLHKFGWVQSDADPNMYYLIEGSYTIVILLYVDDLLLMGRSFTHIAKIKQVLN